MLEEVHNLLSEGEESLIVGGTYLAIYSCLRVWGEESLIIGRGLLISLHCLGEWGEDSLIVGRGLIANSLSCGH